MQHQLGKQVQDSSTVIRLVSGELVLSFAFLRASLYVYVLSENYELINITN